jgi:hypothetical protein
MHFVNLTVLPLNTPLPIGLGSQSDEGESMNLPEWSQVKKEQGEGKAPLGQPHPLAWATDKPIPHRRA